MTFNHEHFRTGELLGTYRLADAGTATVAVEVRPVLLQAAAGA